MTLPKRVDLFAEELLARASQTSLPVDLQSVIESIPNLTVRLSSLKAHGYFLSYGFGIGQEIVIRKEDERGQRRFSLAHEIGHWSLRQISVLSGDYDLRYTHKEVNSEIEQWCDRFATELLMPRKILADRFSSVPESKIAAAVFGFARMCDVSVSAMARRIVDVCGAVTMVVYRSGERRRWLSPGITPTERSLVTNEMVALERRLRVTHKRSASVRVDEWVICAATEASNRTIVLMAVRSNA